MSNEWGFLDDLSKEIVALLIKYPEGLGFNDIVRLTGKPKETVNRRLTFLREKLGVIEREYRGRGRKTIYRLSGDRKQKIKELLIARNIIPLFLLDFAKSFMDLLSMDRDKHAYSLLCQFSLGFSGYLALSLTIIYNDLLELGYDIVEKENVSKAKLENILRNIAMFSVFERLDIDYILVNVAAETAIKMIDEGKRKKMPSKAILELCRNWEEIDQLALEGLSILAKQMKSHAERLLKLYEKTKIEQDSLKAFREIYWNAAKKYVEEYIGLR